MSIGNLSDLLVAMSRHQPDRVAVDAPTRRLTYRELAALASQTARELAGRGVTAGMRVGIANRRNEDVFVQAMAVWMLGATGVLVDFRTRAPERVALARDMELGFVLEDKPVGTGGACPCAVTDEAWNEAVARRSGEAMYSPEGDAPALVALTSGSSGVRMGAAIDHATLFMRAHLPGTLAARDAGGRLLMLSPMSFAAGMHVTIAHLVYGGTIVYMPVLFGAQEVSDTVLSRDITSVFCVPTVLRGLLDLWGERTTPAFPRLNFLYCAGAPSTPREKRLVHRTLSDRFVEIYATTLCGRIAMLDNDEVQLHAESVGRALPQVNLQVVRPDGTELPAGEAGAIRVRTPAMTLEVCGPGGARQRGDRVAGGWAYTGDIGLLDAGGFLHLLGRDSEMIIRGGENVYPAELEAAALELAGVKEAVAVGFPAAAVGEEIAMFIVAGPQVTEEALAAHLRARLTPNKNPRVIRFVEGIRKNDNNKVDYPALKLELAA